MDILVDGQKVVTWTSSGTTAGFEAVELGGITGQMVELQGVLADSEWLSIMEVRVALYLRVAGFKICCVGVMCFGLFRRSRTVHGNRRVVVADSFVGRLPSFDILSFSRTLCLPRNRRRCIQLRNLPQLRLTSSESFYLLCSGVRSFRLTLSFFNAVLFCRTTGGDYG